VRSLVDTLGVFPGAWRFGDAVGPGAPARSPGAD